MRFNKCKRCSQHACLASGSLQYCGDHWRDHQAQEQAQDQLSIRLQRLEEAETVDDLKPLIRELIEELHSKG